MEEQELLLAIPNFLTNLPGAQPQRVLDQDRSWWIRPNVAVSVVSLFQEAEIRVTTLVACLVPMSGELLGYLNYCNFKELVYGRIFCSIDNNAGTCDVLMQDIVRGDSFSMDHLLEVRNFLLRTGSVTSTGDRLAGEVVSRYGGRPPEDNGTDFITPFAAQ